MVSRRAAALARMRGLGHDVHGGALVWALASPCVACCSRRSARRRALQHGQAGRGCMRRRPCALGGWRCSGRWGAARAACWAPRRARAALRSEAARPPRQRGWRRPLPRARPGRRAQGCQWGLAQAFQPDVCSLRGCPVGGLRRRVRRRRAPRPAHPGRRPRRARRPAHGRPAAWQRRRRPCGRSQGGRVCSHGAAAPARPASP